MREVPLSLSLSSLPLCWSVVRCKGERAEQLEHHERLVMRPLGQLIELEGR